MGIAYDYLVRQHSKAYADAIELDRVRTDITGMEAQLEKVTKELAGARQYAAILTNSISTAQQLVEDECKRNEWPLPETPAAPPAPAPIGDGITRETTTTLAIPAYGREGGAWAHLIGEWVTVRYEDGDVHDPVRLDDIAEGMVFLSDRDGNALGRLPLHTIATIVTVLDDRHLPAPALQEGADGSPLLTTVLPPHGVEATREDA